MTAPLGRDVLRAGRESIRHGQALLRDVNDLTRGWAQHVESGPATWDGLAQQVIEGLDLYADDVGRAVAGTVAQVGTDAAGRVGISLAKIVPDAGADLVVDAVERAADAVTADADLTAFDASSRVRSAWVGDRFDPYAVNRDVIGFLESARQSGIDPQQAQDDLARLIRGEDIDYASYGLDRTALTALRTTEYRARRVAVTEVMTAARESTVAVLRDSGLVTHATWTLSPLHDEVDECDDLAGQQWPLTDWPETHPFCRCTPGPPFTLAGEEPPEPIAPPEPEPEPAPVLEGEQLALPGLEPAVPTPSAGGYSLKGWSSPLDDNTDWEQNKWARTWTTLGKDQNMTLPEVREALDKQVARMTADPEVHVWMRASADETMVAIEQDGGFRSQVEGAPTSGGIFDPDFRRHVDLSLFGDAAISGPNDRASIYGYLDHGAEGAEHMQRYLGQYGEIRFRLKDDVKTRTTFTWGDSLDENAQAFKPGQVTYYDMVNVRPSSFLDPDGRAFGARGFSGPQGLPALREPDMDVHDLMGMAHPYLEAQVHGGVDLSDVAEMWLPSPAFARYGLSDEAFTAMVARLRGMGITVNVWTR